MLVCFLISCLFSYFKKRSLSYLSNLGARLLDAGRKVPVHPLEFTESGEPVSFQRKLQQSVICENKEVQAVEPTGRRGGAGWQAFPAAPQASSSLLIRPGDLWFFTSESVERRMVMNKGKSMSTLLGGRNTSHQQTLLDCI